MKFKPRDTIIRHDLPYPDGALTFVGYSAHGDLRAHPYGGGPELIIPAEEEALFMRVCAGEATPIYRRCRFEIEGVEESFEGWTDGTRWNGWQKPYFEFSIALRVVEVFTASTGYFDPSSDAFITEGQDEPEAWRGTILSLPDGGTVKAYPIGAGSWIWDKAS